MKYRMLGKSERPDKAKGDQYRTPSVNRDLWHATSLRGKRTVAECNRAGNPCEYRRPANTGIGRDLLTEFARGVGHDQQMHRVAEMADAPRPQAPDSGQPEHGGEAAGSSPAPVPNAGGETLAVANILHRYVCACFVITAKGPGLHRQFKGTATIKSGKASAATILLGMLNQVITQDGLTGDTSITANITLKPNEKADGVR